MGNPGSATELGPALRVFVNKAQSEIRQGHEYQGHADQSEVIQPQVPVRLKRYSLSASCRCHHLH